MAIRLALLDLERYRLDLDRDRLELSTKLNALTQEVRSSTLSSDLDVLTRCTGAPREAARCSSAIGVVGALRFRRIDERIPGTISTYAQS